MSTQNTNYDDVKQYRLDPAREEELLKTGGECVFCWANKAGHPIGVITAYVPAKGKIWMTATKERVRIKAIARDGRSSVVIRVTGMQSFVAVRRLPCEETWTPTSLAA